MEVAPPGAFSDPLHGDRGDARDHRFEPITATRPYAPKV
jgi:hypothetical protein